MSNKKIYQGTLGFSQNISHYHHGHESLIGPDMDHSISQEFFPECNPPAYEVKSIAPLKSQAKPKEGMVLPRSLDNLIIFYFSQKYINN